MLHYLSQAVQVEVGDNTINKPDDGWTRRLIMDDEDNPMLYYKLEGLKQNSKYELQVRARNNVGWSLPNNAFYFYTAQGEYSAVWVCPFAQSIG